LDSKLLGQIVGRGEQERFLAQMAENSGDYNAAIERLKHFVEYRKSDIYREYSSMGRIYLKQGQIESALRYFRMSRDHRSIYPDQVVDREEQKAFAVEYLDMIREYGSLDERALFLEQLGKNPANNDVMAALKASGKV